MEQEIDLNKIKNVYFVGIKGVAMTALAIYLKQLGRKVSGSDVEEVFLTDTVLKKHKIFFRNGFYPINIDPKIDLVIATGAHQGANNIEVKRAKELGIPVLMHGQALAYFTQGKQTISVAGTHGKTTTSALISQVLQDSGLDPSYAIGCFDAPSLAGPSHKGNGEYFIVEADEYATCPISCKKARFLWQEPYILVITNIEYDHPDIYKDLKEVREAFFQFCKRLKKNGKLIACIDDLTVQSIVKKGLYKTLTFGFSPRADIRVERVTFVKGRTWFWLRYQGKLIDQFCLRIAGAHNCSNAAAAAGVGLSLGLSWTDIKKALFNFAGVKRRFELIGNVGNVFVYDDYAHHPTEVKVTLKAARDWFFGRKIICLFQPHTYSRTKALFDEFVSCFNYANYIFITDIFASAREKKGDFNINSQCLVEKIKIFNRYAYYVKNVNEFLDKVAPFIKEKSVIITLGAGNIYTWHPQILSALREIYGEKDN